jgi:hypothetical protein
MSSYYALVHEIMTTSGRMKKAKQDRPSSKKIKVPRYTPLRRLGGEEV